MNLVLKLNKNIQLLVNKPRTQILYKMIHNLMDMEDVEDLKTIKVIN